MSLGFHIHKASNAPGLSTQNGCEWDSWTCWGAAKGGHLEVLRWARENGCPWNPSECLTASAQQPAVIAWIEEWQARYAVTA